MYNSIIFEKKENVLKIILNRPEVYNAFNTEMLTELKDAFGKAEEDDEARCIILSGAGKAFCSGQDLKDFNEKKLTFKEALDRNYNPLIKKIATLPKPVVCAVNGVAAGAGISLVLACDYRIAVESAVLTEVFINIGLVPDSGSSFFLPRIAGLSAAFELCSTGDKITASAGKEIGLINKIVYSPKLLMKCAEIKAKRFAESPTMAIGLIKNTLNKAFESSLDEILVEEAENQDLAGKTEDFREGINSFLEKRKAVFKGK